jgi:hypothetical protein
MESYIVRSRTKPDVRYSVINIDGDWSCDCKWDTIRRKNCRKDCIHIKLAKVMGPQINVTAATPTPNTTECVQYASSTQMKMNA